MIINVPGINTTPSASQISVSDEVQKLTGAENVDDALKTIKNESIKKELIAQYDMENSKYVSGDTIIGKFSYTEEILQKYFMLVFEFEGTLTQSGAGYGYLYLGHTNTSDRDSILLCIQGTDSATIKAKTHIPLVAAMKSSNGQTTATLIIGSSRQQLNTNDSYSKYLYFSDNQVTGTGIFKIYGVSLA